jgi:molybdate transport system substrate-binding protein
MSGEHCDARPWRPSRRRTALLLALASMWLTVACGRADRGAGDDPSGSPASTEPTLVFAAASLTASFQELADAFEAEHRGARLGLSFAGTPKLVLQIREGAPASVFASADEANMAKVVELGRVADRARVFAHNRLAIVVAEGNPKGVEGLSDLAAERGKDLRVVLCGPEVPAGRYARQALQKAGVEVRSLSDEPSVKAVVNKVRLGEVDAGIVYVTDIAAAADDVDAVPIPDGFNVLGTYPIALLKTADGVAPRPDSLAARFVDFVLSERGRAILADYGFTAP